jgi:hypothetical protein
MTRGMTGTSRGSELSLLKNRSACRGGRAQFGWGATMSVARRADTDGMSLCSRAIHLIVVSVNAD